MATPASACLRIWKGALSVSRAPVSRSWGPKQVPRRIAVRSNEKSLGEAQGDGLAGQLGERVERARLRRGGLLLEDRGREGRLAVDRPRSEDQDTPDTVDGRCPDRVGDPGHVDRAHTGRVAPLPRDVGGDRGAEDHGLDPLPNERRVEGARMGEVGLHEAVGGPGGGLCGRRPVHPDHPLAPGEQRLGQGRPEEPRGAGEEDAHGRSPRRSSHWPPSSAFDLPVAASRKL